MEFERLEPNFGLLIPDFFEDYPEATEEIDPGFQPHMDLSWKQLSLLTEIMPMTIKQDDPL